MLEAHGNRFLTTAVIFSQQSLPVQACKKDETYCNAKVRSEVVYFSWILANKFLEESVQLYAEAGTAKSQSWLFVRWKDISQK